MTLLTIIKARNVIDGFAMRDGLSAHLAYWMAKFIAKTEDDNKFYAEGLRKITEKYHVTVGEDGMWKTDENVEDLEKEITELQDTEAQDPGIKFSLSEISDCLKVSLQEMYPLLDFIDENT